MTCALPEAKVGGGTITFVYVSSRVSSMLNAVIKMSSQFNSKHSIARSLTILTSCRPKIVFDMKGKSRVNTARSARRRVSGQSAVQSATISGHSPATRTRGGDNVSQRNGLDASIETDMNVGFRKASNISAGSVRVMRKLQRLLGHHQGLRPIVLQ